MNALEKKMVTILKDLKENHNVNGVKAEYEAEGTRLEEMLRLKEVTMKADVGLTIKIGGGEALRDMYECREIGVVRVVAPMIESPYALKKFLAAAKMAFGEEASEIDFAVNIETITAVQNFDEMLKLDEIGELNGVVFGRVDMCGSLGLTREDINCDEISRIAEEVFTKSKRHHLETAIGGGVSKYSLPIFERFPSGILDRFETRKVIFGFPFDHDLLTEGIYKAVGFELMWLKNKRDYYKTISEEDLKRIEMLEDRYRSSIEKVGGMVE